MKRTRLARRFKPGDYLPASELARFGRCERLVAMEKKHGLVVTEESEAARKAGIAEHLRFHEMMTRAHNRSDTGAGASARLLRRQPAARTLDFGPVRRCGIGGHDVGLGQDQDRPPATGERKRWRA